MKKNLSVILSCVFLILSGCTVAEDVLSKGKNKALGDTKSDPVYQMKRRPALNPGGKVGQDNYPMNNYMPSQNPMAQHNGGAGFDPMSRPMPTMPGMENEPYMHNSMGNDMGLVPLSPEYQPGPKVGFQPYGGPVSGNRAASPDDDPSGFGYPNAEDGGFAPPSGGSGGSGGGGFLDSIKGLFGGGSSKNEVAPESIKSANNNELREVVNFEKLSFNPSNQEDGVTNHNSETDLAANFPKLGDVPETPVRFINRENTPTDENGLIQMRDDANAKRDSIHSNEEPKEKKPEDKSKPDDESSSEKTLDKENLKITIKESPKLNIPKEAIMQVPSYDISNAENSASYITNVPESAIKIDLSSVDRKTLPAEKRYQKKRRANDYPY